jgi:glycosyltransferase involved in cell wall biosynthesis
MRRRLPVLRTEHGVHHYLDPSCRLYRSWALRHTDSVVAVSDYVRRFVAARAPFAEPKLQVVRNGVDAGYFHPAPPPGEGPFTFTVVGRLEPWKRVDLVLGAMHRVPEIRLLVAGDGSVRRKLETLSARLGLADRVTFLGYRRDPRPVFASCDAAINSSRDEPLGLSVLEAMAMQRPVVGFAAGGIPEIVRDRETGWLVRKGSVEALGAALAAASASRAEAARLGAAARAFVERECQIEEMCRGYAQAYAALDDRAGD